MQKLTRSEAKFSNTSKKMDQALLELLENKGWNEISISEICKKAGINRSTFYSHYSTIYDLYSETYENLIAQFYNFFRKKIIKTKTSALNLFFLKNILFRILNL